MFNFDLHNGFVLLRIVVAVFMFPHAYGKIKYREGTNGFFTAAGLKPADTFRMFGFAFEVVVGSALILGIFTQICAILTCVFMLVATAANHRVCKGKWLWNMGGSEYPLFWACCAAIVAMNPT